MTFVEDSLNTPHTLRFQKKTTEIQWIVKGQGVLLFEHTDVHSPCTFDLVNAAKEVVLTVEFKTMGIDVGYNGNPLVDPNNTKGLVSTPGAYYWISLDAQNQRIMTGIGEARKETVLYQYQLPNQEKQCLESLTTIQITNAVSNPLRLLRDPITRTVPLNVLNTNKLTMSHIAQGNHMPVANLSAIGQKLYGCIAGPRFVLDDKDFPEFSKAIEYSIATPSCWCYETLVAKSKEFGEPNIKETYLRITLNENNGESPGIPYVMEIWPVGHYSPVHNHGGAEAIIRVLHGGIHVQLFSFLGGNSFGSAEFKKGDCTWISPTLNQVHQLKNKDSNKDTCITIQCYMYDSDDTRHYDYFDYLDAKGAVQQFTPNSDMDFLAFKEQMRKEWAARPKGIFSRALDCVKRLLHIRC
jgi:hypothetical protein